METRKSSSADDVNTYGMRMKRILEVARDPTESTEKVKAARTKEKCTKTKSTNNRFNSHFRSFCMRARTHTHTVLDDCHQNMANRSNLAGQKIDNGTAQHQTNVPPHTHTRASARPKYIFLSIFPASFPIHFDCGNERRAGPRPRLILIRTHLHAAFFLWQIEIHVFPSSPTGIQCAFSYINIIIWQQKGIVHVHRVRAYTHNGIHM